MNNNPKNICFVIPRLIEGGAGRSVLCLAAELLKLGQRVSIIILENRIDYPVESGINLHIFHDKPNSKNAKNFKKQFQQLNIQFDLIISNSPITDNLCKKAKLPNLYFCIHSTISSSIDAQGKNDGQIRKRFISRIKQIFSVKSPAKNQQKLINSKEIKHLMANLDLQNRVLFIRGMKRPFLVKSLYKNQNLICVSKGVKNDLLDFGIKPKTAKTIYNSFDFADIQNSSEKYQADEKNYIIHIGRFDKSQKRQDILIKAYKKSGIGQKLLLFGDDNNSVGEEIRQLVTDLDLTEKVIFKGFNPNPFPYIKNAKCLVLSSAVEGLPTVLIEALVLGVPVVSTDCKSGPSEILIDELQPFLSPVGNISALAKNIKKMVENPVKITPKYYQRFSSDECAKKYLALCDLTVNIIADFHPHQRRHSTPPPPAAILNSQALLGSILNCPTPSF